jgi:hypothetical protein
VPDRKSTFFIDAPAALSEEGSRIEHVIKIVCGEKCAPAFTGREKVHRIENEMAYFKELRLATVVAQLFCFMARMAPCSGGSAI